MWVRTAAFMASIFIAANVLAAEVTSSAACEYGASQAGKTVRFDPSGVIARGKPGVQAPAVFSPLSFGQMGYDENGRGPNPHARGLAKIAVFDSVGSRDAVEIASTQLRQFGVTREEIQDSIAWTKLHGGGTGLPLPSQRGDEIDPSSLNANSVWVVSY